LIRKKKKKNPLLDIYYQKSNLLLLDLQIAERERESEEQREGDRPESGNEQRAEAGERAAAGERE
jgi:hypothetical protein